MVFAPFSANKSAEQGRTNELKLVERERDKGIEKNTGDRCKQRIEGKGAKKQTRILIDQLARL